MSKLQTLPPGPLRASGALTLAAALLCACSSEPPRPSVLLISIDTLRADHLSSYGYGRETSPRIDDLADQGVLFEQHISSSSWTLPAHTALFTGVSDSVHGCTEVIGRSLAPAFTTLAERFQQAGYPTGGFYAGPYLHAAFGLGQGFDVYRYCATNTGELDQESSDDWAMDKDVMVASHTGITNPSVYEQARSWMEERRDEPFFCFVHLWDVHFDFIPPEPYDTLFDPDYEGSFTGEGFFFNEDIRAGRLDQRDKEHLVALYDGEIRWTDTFVGKLLDDLEEWGLDEDTIVVVTADHGTEFWEHGNFAHRTTLYDEQIHIPLVMRYPRALPEGLRVEGQSRIIDIAPTLLQLADLPDLPDPMGSSLLPLVAGEEQEERLAFSELYSVGRNLQTIRSAELKHELDLDRRVNRFFDLRADPRERQPLLRLDAEAAGRAQERYVRVMEELGEAVARRPAGPDEAAVPEAVSSALEALGYTGSSDDEE